MLFDQIQFAAVVNELAVSGKPGSLEEYLTKEISRLEEGGMISAAGIACSCGKTPEQMGEEDAAFQRNRYEGLIAVGSELANVFRNRSDWDGCRSTYETLLRHVDEAGLSGTPIHARVLVNEAYALNDAGDQDCSLAVLADAEKVCDDPGSEVLSRLYDIRAVILRRMGDSAGASEAAAKALEAIVMGAPSHSELVSMLLNHAATLAQLGDTKSALAAVDELLSPESENPLKGDARYQALNLKAMVFYRSGDFRSAADSFAQVVSEASTAGELMGQLPNICMNCSQMYQRAGDEDAARTYSSLAASLSSGMH